MLVFVALADRDVLAQRCMLMTWPGEIDLALDAMQTRLRKAESGY